MKIVVRDRRFRTGIYEAWKVVFEVDAKTVPNNIPLTEKVISHHKMDKNSVGYATMRGLKLEDIISIISSSKRGEGHMNIERWGRVAYYKLPLVSRIR